MFDCIKSHSTWWSIGALNLRLVIASLIALSFANYSNAQLPELSPENREPIEELPKASDIETIKTLVKEFEDGVKIAFENSNFLKKAGRNSRNTFTKWTGGKALPTDIERASIWDDNSDLIANRLETVGLFADSSASYGLFGFMGAKYDEFGNVCRNGEQGKPLTLKISGRFPNAQYMSLQIYSGRPLQGSKGVGEPLSDYKIVPLTGQNRFATGNRNDEGNFEIFIVPVDDVEAAKKKGTPPNTIYYEAKDYEPEEDGDTSVITAFYRVYLPEGGRLKREDLPNIEGFLTEPTGALNPRDNLGKQVHPEFAKLVKSWYPDIPVGNIIFNVSRFWEKKESLRWFNVNRVFKVIEKFAGQGASKDIRYEMCFKQVAVGEYVVIKFRAPELYFGGGPDDHIARKAVRYWSICPTYYPRLAGINSLPCDINQPWERDITVVFGKDRPEAREHARRLGAEFLPDTREESHRVVTFLLRNMLSSNFVDPAQPEKENKIADSLKKLSEVADAHPSLNTKIHELEKELLSNGEERWMFNGVYKPKGEVYSLREFLDLKKETLDAEVGDEK